MPFDSKTQAAAIEIRGLTKAYGRTMVLRGLDMDIPWGQVVTVLGANGSGKSTLMRILSSVTRPDGGAVRIGGMDLAKHGPALRRTIGVVSHDPLLYNDMSGYENLKFFGRMFSLDRLDERIAANAERLAITPRLHQRVGTLSHGWRKRISIARALLHDPLLLLLDEPESGLDQSALGVLEGIIRDRSNRDRSIIMTTHNLERGISIGDQVAIFSRGVIAFQQPVAAAAAGAEGIRRAYFEHVGAAQ
ncbi:MAG: ABC transporter ATP-binding protein [SAR202 cluster bacterium]|nr:ABC transporter ATP-binding protein [SAR202 cluster bacterium]